MKKPRRLERRESSKSFQKDNPCVKFGLSHPPRLFWSNPFRIQAARRYKNLFTFNWFSSLLLWYGHKNQGREGDTKEANISRISPLASQGRVLVIAVRQNTYKKIQRNQRARVFNGVILRRPSPRRHCLAASPSGGIRTEVLPTSPSPVTQVQKTLT